MSSVVLDGAVSRWGQNMAVSQRRTRPRPLFSVSDPDLKTLLGAEGASADHDIFGESKGRARRIAGLFPLSIRAVNGFFVILVAIIMLGISQSELRGARMTRIRTMTEATLAISGNEIEATAPASTADRAVSLTGAEYTGRIKSSAKPQSVDDKQHMGAGMRSSRENMTMNDPIAIESREEDRFGSSEALNTKRRKHSNEEKPSAIETTSSDSRDHASVDAHTTDREAAIEDSKTGIDDATAESAESGGKSLDSIDSKSMRVVEDTDGTLNASLKEERAAVGGKAKPETAGSVSEEHTGENPSNELRRGSPQDSPDPIEEENLSEVLGFTARTTLNYFHLHKTGGVSYKGRVFDFFSTKSRVDTSGKPAFVMDTCHMTGPDRPELGSEASWSCDWKMFEAIPERNRRDVDIIVGHQYWEHGAMHFVPNRDMRYFTVLRHPFDRKMSFFYHFFVRNAGRTEASVVEEELIRFMLGEEMPRSPLVRDAGPDYYASRLWSDGMKGFHAHRFNIEDIESKDAEQTILDSITRLKRNFVFIGLQRQEKASLCMLRRTVEEFCAAHGITNMTNVGSLDAPRARLNTGSYPMSSRELWMQMTDEQKKEFKRVERVDLGIYRASLDMFRRMAKQFKCDHLVDHNVDETLALEK